MYNKNNNILINNLYNKNNLPYSIEAEQSIIGCLMINNNNFYDVLEKIDSNDFYIYNHKVIFNEMKLLIESKKPIDLITISESLNKKKI
ncbi:DnaB-like helicase N-terminal domain-containing protein [Candidatus Nardonella dryophthoridicola]|uniref:DNA helicase DnaB-like N-terminal domain-containing protein n=1 Tax=endosymbiont of Metamasius hemipterus TaxID=204627 RepID=A0ABT0TW87_9GAMM|nr:DnaB-like helicase N-terminal domain-containing protein [Candidatus Nardonella dryophthoridicola]MCM0158256.1 hypothetical protein [endosymbiont of Metamasius hemipterus]